VKTQEQQLDILFNKREDISFREAGRINGCDPRTAKKYMEHPELIGKSRQSPPRGSLVDPYANLIECYLDDDQGNHRESWIYGQMVKSGYQGGYEIVNRFVRGLKERECRLALPGLRGTQGAL